MAGHESTSRSQTMRCRNCGQTRRMTLLIEFGVQVSATGARRLPDWNVGVQCPRCASTDVVADRGRLLASAVGAGEV